MWQIQNFHSFLWASGGCYSDFLIHNIDECCWMKDAWPVKAEAIGGRHYRGNNVDQNFDVYAVEYTFADGAKLYLDGRVHGRTATTTSPAMPTAPRARPSISYSSHSPSKCRIFKDQRIEGGQVWWAFPQPEPNPYQLEWDRPGGRDSPG